MSQFMFAPTSLDTLLLRARLSPPRESLGGKSLAHETTFVLPPTHSLSDDSDDESAVVRRERKKEKGGLFQKTNTQTTNKTKRKHTCVRETAVVSKQEGNVGWTGGTESCVEGHHGTSLKCPLGTEGVAVYIGCL